MSVMWWELFPNLKSMCTLRGNNVFILPGMLLNFMKFLYPWGENVISVSPGGIFLNGHMTGQPFNSVNWLVKPWSSQCCQYLTLVTRSLIGKPASHSVGHTTLLLLIISNMPPSRQCVTMEWQWQPMIASAKLPLLFARQETIWLLGRLIRKTAEN